MAKMISKRVKISRQVWKPALRMGGMLVGVVVAAIIVSPLMASPALADPPRPDSDPEDGGMIPEQFIAPRLPERPSQVQVGGEVYFYHCMPCHGDVGQGLTDEFRHAWVSDHQNCWAPGCHGGRVGDGGFPIPKFVPDVINLKHFPTPESLFAYLKATHPPQYPGKLNDEQYWSASAHILYLAGRLEADDQIGPKVENIPEWALAMAALAWFVTLVVFLQIAGKQR